MTAFAPSRPDLADTPHHHATDLPPPPQLQHGPFSHQLNTSTSVFPPVNSSTPPRVARRSSTDFRHASNGGNMVGANGNAPMPVPGGMRNGHGHAANMRDMGFAGPRSPTNSSKNTSHVPCKFYRQGTCQAGKACPFLHSDEPMTETAPCKYFTKGNCKFGAKCALAHILPNGHIVNRHNVGKNHFGRVHIPHQPEYPPDRSLLSAQMGPYGYPGGDEYYTHNIPTIDTTFSPHRGSNYGSPPNENGRMPISPVQKGLSVMDVQLPASFDSQGISHMARYGPIASSVPSKFLANSPPSSFQGDSPALRNLHNSAFGDDRGKSAALGSSPPESIEQPLGRRIMHSEMGASRRGMLSASVGARPPMHDEWEDSELVGGGKFEDDLIPGLLTGLLDPKDNPRHSSRDFGDDGSALSHKGSLSRLGASPTTSDIKVGSPSRFQSLWGKSQPSNNGGFESGSLPGVSAFGHVGSPLRNSALHPGAGPSLRAVSRPATGEAPFVSSPPRQASMSMISQQLQRTRLSSRASEEHITMGGNPIHPGLNRVTSGSSVGSSSGRLGMDRAVSSSSIGRERIEEEQGLFSMEEEEDVAKGKDGASTTSSTSNKRLSGLSWGSGGKAASPNLAPIGGHRAAGSGLARDPHNPWGSNA